MFVLLNKININDKSDQIKIWWCKINTIQLYMKKMMMCLNQQNW